MNNNNENNPNQPQGPPLASLKGLTPLEEVLQLAFPSDSDSHNRFHRILDENDVTPQMILELSKDEWDELEIKSVGVKKKLKNAATQFLDAARTRDGLSQAPSRASFSMVTDGQSFPPTDPSLVQFPGTTEPLDQDPELAQFFGSFTELAPESLGRGVDPNLQYLFAQVASQAATKVADAVANHAVANQNPSQSAVDDEWYKQYSEDFQEETLSKTSCHTFKNELSCIRYYDQNVRDGGAPFATENADVILQKMLDFLKTKDISSVSKLTYLVQTMKTIRHAKKNPSQRMKRVVLDAANFYKSAGKYEKKTGKQNATGAAITKRDNKHVLNSLILRYRGFDSGKIPPCVWQVEANKLISQTTGRRMIEVITIAPASFKWLSTPGEARCLEYAYACEKRTGPGVYYSSITSNQNLQGNAVAMVCGYLQSIGAVKSAEAVYNYEEPLQIDSTKFETVQELARKLEIAKKSLNKSLRNKLDTYLKSNDANDDDDDDDDDYASVEKIGSIYTTLFDALGDVDDDEPLRIPWMCNFGARDHQPTTSRKSYHIAMVAFRDSMKSFGYISSHKNRIGITNCRHDFIQDTRNAFNYGVDMDRHMTIHAGHSTTTAIQYYENPNDSKRRVPANIFQEGVDPETVKALVANAKTPAMFEDPGHFQTNWQIREDPLPTAPDFLHEFGWSPSFFGNCFCSAVGCDQTFMYVSDLLNHMKHGHGKEDRFQCVECQRSYAKETFLKHTNKDSRQRCSGLHDTNPLFSRADFAPRLIDGNGRPRPGVWVEQCSLCSSWFSSHSDLTKHMKKVHKIKSSKQSVPSQKSVPVPEKLHDAMTNPRAQKKRRNN